MAGRPRLAQKITPETGGGDFDSKNLLLSCLRGFGRRAHGATATDWRVVHHQATAATGIAHGGQAIAAGLNHRATLGVARRAGDAASILGGFAHAHAHRQAAGANRHAVHHAAAGAETVLQHHAQVLHHAAGHRVVTHAMNLHAASALFEAHRATRHHHVVRADRHRRRHSRRCAHRRHPHRRHGHLCAVHHHCAHSSDSILEDGSPARLSLGHPRPWWNYSHMGV